MTNRSKFEFENIEHACYFVVSAWLSNFCHVFSYLLGPIWLKNGVSLKADKGFENWGRR